MFPRISCRAWWRWRTSCGFPYRKPHTRTWLMQRAGNPGRTSVHGTKKMGVALSNVLLCGPADYFLEGRVLLAHRVKAFEKIVFGPCTLMRTWGTRLGRSRNELLFQGERLGLERSIALLKQNLNFALSAIQLLFALRREAHALLEHLDRVFERQVTPLQLGDNPFQLFQRFLKRCQRRPPPLQESQLRRNTAQTARSPARPGSSAVPQPAFPAR